MGLGLCAALGVANLSEKPVAYTMVAVDVVLAIGLALEVAAFSAVGISRLCRWSAWWLRLSLLLC